MPRSLGFLSNLARIRIKRDMYIFLVSSRRPLQAELGSRQDTMAFLYSCEIVRRSFSQVHAVNNEADIRSWFPWGEASEPIKGHFGTNDPAEPIVPTLFWMRMPAS